MSDMRASRNQPRGISLIEVMITLTILAVVALALADGLVTSMKVTSTNEERAAVMRAARDKLEWVQGNKILLINSDAVGPDGVTLRSSMSGYTPIYPRFEIDTLANKGVIKGIQATSISPTDSTQGGPFDVFFAQKGQTANNVAGTANEERLPGLFSPTVAAGNGTLNGDRPGEIVVMYDEAVTTLRADNTYAYGRDLTGGPKTASSLFGTPDGQPDGTTFPPIGDMDMDGNVGGGPFWDMRWLAFDSKSAGMHGRVPVGVIIRWTGASGREERYELWTVMSFFQENFGSKTVPVNRYD